MMEGKGVAMRVAQPMAMAEGTRSLRMANNQEAEHLDWTQMQEQTLKR